MAATKKEKRKRQSAELLTLTTAVTQAVERRLASLQKPKAA